MTIFDNMLEETLEIELTRSTLKEANKDVRFNERTRKIELCSKGIGWHELDSHDCIDFVRDLHRRIVLNPQGTVIDQIRLAFMGPGMNKPPAISKEYAKHLLEQLGRINKFTPTPLAHIKDTIKNYFWYQLPKALDQLFKAST